MEYKILLPQIIWQDYNPESQALEAYLEDTASDGNISIKTYKFTAHTVDGEKLTAAVKVYNSLADFKRTALIVQEYHRTPTKELLYDLALSGYTVVVPDISGVADPPTVFPEAVKYGKFSEAGDHIKKVMPTAKETCQYLYTVIVKRTLYFIKEVVAPYPVALIGLGDAVEVAMQVAGSGSKVDALACLNSGGYREYIKLNKYETGKELEMDEERISWLTGVASVAYAKYVTAPVFIALGTNSEKSDMDRLENLIALIPGDRVYTSLSPRAGDFLLPNAYRTLKIWLSRMLSGEAFPDCPKIAARVNEDGKIYVDADCDPGSMIERVSFYYSYGEYNHEIRDWNRTDGIAVSFNEYISTIEVTDADAPLFVFAEAKYENGITLTSPLEYMELAGQPVKAKPVKPSRIVYDSSEGKSDFVECYKGEVLMSYGLEIVTTPSGTKGIKARHGSLKTYNIDTRLSSNTDSLLQVEVYSERECEAEIVLREKTKDGIKRYCATINIDDTKGFFIANKLKLTDFKDERFMPLTSWVNIRSIEINGMDIVIGNILFI